ncbi:hypothetical protein [Natrinema amylolyticum]|uniref:hypothetical protein n=1 Tax=Natrinema amylolyticum TaxID=2878679 RepID=UPI001CFBD99A|nr:hypothetical protein [Natrinema amylolyticum]
MITELTRSVLADVQNTDDTTALEDLDEETRRNAKRRLREIDAETRRVGLELFGPELSLPDHKDNESTDDVPEVVRSDSFTTSYLGPEPRAFQRVQEDRSPKRETDTQDDPNHSDGDRDER